MTIKWYQRQKNKGKEGHVKENTELSLKSTKLVDVKGLEERGIFIGM